jgi:hypothetical protein
LKERDPWGGFALGDLEVRLAIYLDCQNWGCGRCNSLLPAGILSKEMIVCGSCKGKRISCLDGKAAGESIPDYHCIVNELYLGDLGQDIVYLCCGWVPSEH